jgi:hypothetical protein
MTTNNVFRRPPRSSQGEEAGRKEIQEGKKMKRAVKTLS